ncbi:MAG: 7-carboxy-7-deazaguanine synthase QueE [Bacteroidetes bacterium]|nr:7-carboxy-7-deazaguanine synthase QueE [Bacteroidota bacterium]
MDHFDILFNDGKKLPLVEQFYSIQGEGYHTGKPAWFIRVGGCDIGCRWCDTKFSWNKELHPVVDTDEIIANAIACPAKALVVTGGEPLLYDLGYLCSEVRKHGVKTYLETSGSCKLSGTWDWICLSPKKNNPPLKEIYTKTNELKVIIESEDDFDWAAGNAVFAGKNCKLFLQPEWSRFDTIIHPVVEYVKKNPKWSISLQAHKFMRIP